MKYLLLLASILYAESTQLHIATWPTNAEYSLGTAPDPSEEHILTSPSVQKVRLDSGTIRLYFFKPGFGDTAVLVKLKPQPDNFIFLHLQPETDSSSLDEQNAFLAHRAMHIWGKRTMWMSIAPTLVAGVFLWQAQASYDRAKKYQHSANESTIKSTPDYRETIQKYEASVEDGDKHKQRAWMAFGAAGAFLVIGGLISF